MQVDRGRPVTLLVFFFLIFVAGAVVEATPPTPAEPPLVADPEGLDNTPILKEKLGDLLPLDTLVIDEKGDSVLLSSLVNKPTILSFVFYKCPSICSPLLQSLAEMTQKVRKIPGIDYQILTLSFNPDDTPRIASEKKANFLKAMKKPIPESSWRFLTASPDNIRKITRAAGFGFKREGDNFLHPSTILVLSPSGKICRYLFGIDFLPFDVEMALIEGVEEKAGATITKVLKFCFSYDPLGRKYVMNITHIVALLTTTILIVFLLFLHFAPFPANPPKVEIPI